jgi:uncharacterized membrane protein YgcG
VRRIASGVIALAIAGLGVLTIDPAPVAHAAVSAGVDDFEFESFDAQYYLSRDADGLAAMRVTERIVALFPDFDQNRGIVRYIPRFYGDNPLNPAIVSVTDDSGKAVHYVASQISEGDSNDDKFVELDLGTDEFVHGRTTYVISYQLHNVIGQFFDYRGDQLYWDVNGTGWAQIFGKVSATVELDPSISDRANGELACYSGPYGATQTCDLHGDATSGYTVTVEKMGPYSTVSIVIGFREGTFVQPALAKNSWVITVAPWALFLVALFFILFAVFVRTLIWRDARGRGIIIPQYSVPSDIDLLLAGDLVRREGTALAAQFVELAIAGYVNVVDLKPDSSVESKDRFALEYVKTTGATAQETKVLEALFGQDPTIGHRAELGSLSPSRGAALYAMRASARQRAISAGLRKLPPGRIDRYLRRSTWLAILAYVAIFVWTIVTGVDDGPVFGFGILSLIACIIASGLITRPYLLTDAGAEKRDYLHGLRDYLSLAEADRLRVLQSPQGAERIDVTDQHAIVRLNEKLLPFAVLWGVEREWSKELSVEYAAVSESPTWVSGNFSSLNFGSFVSVFSSTSTSSVRPLAVSSSGGSSWSSSGGSSFSSGFGGGGFSGGGGGGGGGGGR